MKKILNYSERLEHIMEIKRIQEKSMIPERLNKIKRFKEAGDTSSTLKELKKSTDLITSNLKSIDFNDIDYDEDNGEITIRYDKTTEIELVILNTLLRNENDRIKDRIFGGGETDLYLDITIDRETLNKIDINNGLPNFIKGIGLGKKIYKKLIKDFDYISSFSGYEPSIDSSMTWRSIASDKDIYIFTNDNNIIAFWNEYPYNDIISILDKFYKGTGNCEFDDDFLLKYNLKDDDLKKLLDI